MKCFRPALTIYPPGGWGTDRMKTHYLAVFARKEDAELAASRYAKAYRDKGWEVGVSMEEAYIWGTDRSVDDLPLGEGAERMPDCYSTKTIGMMKRRILPAPPREERA